MDNKLVEKYYNALKDPYLIQILFGFKEQIIPTEYLNMAPRGAKITKSAIIQHIFHFQGVKINKISIQIW